MTSTRQTHLECPYFIRVQSLLLFSHSIWMKWGLCITSVMTSRPGIPKAWERERSFADFLQFRSSRKKCISTSFRFTSDEITPRMCPAFEACTQGSRACINCTQFITSLKQRNSLTSCDSNVWNYVKECLKLFLTKFICCASSSMCILNLLLQQLQCLHTRLQFMLEILKTSISRFRVFPMLSKVFVTPRSGLSPSCPSSSCPRWRTTMQGANRNKSIWFWDGRCTWIYECGKKKGSDWRRLTVPNRRDMKSGNYPDC